MLVLPGELDLLPPGASGNRAVSPLEVLFGVAGVAGIAVAINSFGGAGITAGGDVTGLSAPGVQSQKLITPVKLCAQLDCLFSWQILRISDIAYRRRSQPPGGCEVC